MIPIRYIKQAPKLVSVNGRQYAFTIQHNITLGYVEEQDVDAVLAMKGGCCGGKAHVFRLASEAEERVWKYGGRM